MTVKTKTFAVVASFLIITSLMGPIALTSHQGSSIVGVASASSGTTVDDFEDGDINVETTGFNGWNGDTGNFSTTSSGSINGTSGVLSSSNSKNSVNLQAADSRTDDSIQFTMNISDKSSSSSDQTDIRIYNDTTIGQQITFSDDGKVKVWEYGSATEVGFKWSPGTDYNVTLANIDYTAETYDLLIDGENYGTYGFKNSVSGWTKLQLFTNTQNGAIARDVQIDDVGVGVNYDASRPTSYSFENEPSDGGIPDNFKRADDGTANTIEVTTAKATDGSQSVYLNESTSDNRIRLVPIHQPLSGTTENVTVSVYKSPKDLDGSNGGETTRIEVYDRVDGSDTLMFQTGVHRNGTLMAQDGGGITDVGSVGTDQWVQLQVFNVSVSDDTYSIQWQNATETGYVRNLSMNGSITSDGYEKTILANDEVGYVDDLHFGPRASSTSLSVQVTDQDGNPINQSTVQATVVDQDALDTSNLDQTAQELLDDAENPEPPSYDSRLNLDSEFDDVDAEYVSVHPKSQMSTIEASTGGLDPDVQVASGEEIYLMSWDATDDPGFFGTDLINRQLPGSPTSSTIVIEQLDHSGDVTETRTLKTEDPDSAATIGYIDILTDYSKTHVSTSLPDGFYRISTKNSDFEYVIAVGNPAQIIEQDLKDEADRLTDHAKKMRDRHNNGIFQTVTGETNATGETTLDIPKSASVIQVQAYKGPDASVVGASTTADITMQDVRDSREAGYDEAIYLSTSPKRVDMSKTDGSVTVEMHKLDGGPMENMSDWDQRLEDALNEALNASISELEGVYDDRLETVEREELERRHDQLRDIADRAGLLDRVEELLGREVVDTDTGSDSELRADLGAIEQALAEQQSQGSTGETNTEIDSGKLFSEIPFASDIDPEAISVIVHTEAGESITLPDTEYRIESNGIIDGGDTVVIDGYELPTDTAVADVEVRGVSPAGRTLRERVSAVNPTMAGNVPGIDAIDVNTMRPGPDERVGLQLRPNDADAYDSLSSVDVYGPDGQTVPVTLDGERAYFDTEGEGVYTVRATYAGSDGTEFVETIRLRAGSRMISERPTVRVTEGLTGPTAIVGQGLDSATIETVDGETTITARQPGDATSAPGEIHIEAQQLDASDTITVNVVRGELEESVNAHTNVVIHTNEIGNDALVYRNGKPVTADGDTRFGEYETRENADGVTKTVIYTYSEADGTVQMRISEDPGVVERVLFDLRVRSPVDVPLVGMLYGAVSIADSVPLGPTAALQTVDTPELREADPGEIVPSTGVVNTPGVVAA